jgi:UDP-N-acetylmuramoyl-tripeptide--D-alanyl-D-alanine ligase
MVTTVAPAHLEAFDSIEGIAREKASIFEGLKPGGTAILQCRYRDCGDPERASQALGLQAVTFGADEAADWRLSGRKDLCDTTTCARATRLGEPLLFKVSTPGRHFALNALGALAVADALGATR